MSYVKRHLWKMDVKQRMCHDTTDSLLHNLYFWPESRFDAISESRISTLKTDEKGLLLWIYHPTQDASHQQNSHIFGIPINLHLPPHDWVGGRSKVSIYSWDWHLGFKIFVGCAECFAIVTLGNFAQPRFSQSSLLLLFLSCSRANPCNAERLGITAVELNEAIFVYVAWTHNLHTSIHFPHGAIMCHSLHHWKLPRLLCYFMRLQFVPLRLFTCVAVASLHNWDVPRRPHAPERRKKTT